MSEHDQEIKITADTKKVNLKCMSTWVATWFGAGFMLPAPGTFGSLAAIPFAVILFEITNWPALIIATTALYPIAVWSAKKFAEQTGEHDDSMIVIDEVLGQWLTLAPIYAISGTAPIPTAIGFLLFRLFDIKKPWPVSHFDQNVKNAHGVILDDIVAGIMAGALGTGIIIGLQHAGHL